MWFCWDNLLVSVGIPTQYMGANICAVSFSLDERINIWGQLMYVKPIGYMCKYLPIYRYVYVIQVNGGPWNVHENTHLSGFMCNARRHRVEPSLYVWYVSNIFFDTQPSTYVEAPFLIAVAVRHARGSSEKTSTTYQLSFSLISVTLERVGLWQHGEGRGDRNK